MKSNQHSKRANWNDTLVIRNGDIYYSETESSELSIITDCRLLEIHDRVNNSAHAYYDDYIEHVNKICEQYFGSIDNAVFI